MARANSYDLRVRVLEAIATGMSRRQAAARYRIGVATVIRWAVHAAEQVQGSNPCTPTKEFRDLGGKTGLTAGFANLSRNA